MTHLITRTPELGLQVIRPYIFKDFRGEYTETYNQKEILPNISFVQDSAIVSTCGVLRGYHGDNRTTKLITCLQGIFQIAFVCIDPQDYHYLMPEVMILDDKEKLSLVIPPNFVIAHQCISNSCLFFYKQDTFYKGESRQYSIRWDSWSEVKWPFTPILSDRDAYRSHPAGYYINYGHPDTLLAPERVNP